MKAEGLVEVLAAVFRVTLTRFQSVLRQRARGDLPGGIERAS